MWTTWDGFCSFLNNNTITNVMLIIYFCLQMACSTSAANGTLTRWPIMRRSCDRYSYHLMVMVRSGIFCSITPRSVVGVRVDVPLYERNFLSKLAKRRHFSVGLCPHYKNVLVRHCPRFCISKVVTISKSSPSRHVRMFYAGGFEMMILNG